MSLETATFVSDLNAFNPAAGDPKSQGDDHIRLVKAALKTTFPNANAEISPTPTQFNRLVSSNFLIVDRAYAEYTANADLTSVIPFDDTIPQITEGTQILSASITPKSVNNRVRVRFEGWGYAANNGDAIVAALFLNGGVNAVATAMSGVNFFAGANACGPIVLEYEFVPASMAAQTLTLRVGGTVGTVRMNGNTLGRRFGGTARATLVVEEIAV